jgi:DNA repair protein RadC
VFPQAPHEIGAFIRGYTSRNAEQDVFIRKRPHVNDFTLIWESTVIFPCNSLICINPPSARARLERTESLSYNAANPRRHADAGRHRHPIQVLNREVVMPITDWPRNERPREKLLSRGPHVLSDAELLAIFLRTGTNGKTAVDLARDLLSRYQGLRPLLELDLAEISRNPGVGATKYAQFQAALELGRRYLEAGLKRESPLTTPGATRNYLKSRLRAYPQEVFACLFLDNRHRVICYEELFTGTIDGASVHPREVVRRAIYHNAAALIFAHNHPSGVAEPSHSDRLLTQRLKDALALIDIRVLDHLVVGDAEVVSFAERGFL